MLRNRALSVLGLALLAPLAASQQFTYSAAALPAQNIWTDGVVIVDVDADLDNDIVFANGSAYGGAGATGAQPQHLFLNNGAGVFVAAHAQLNVANFNAKLVIAPDLDNDGDPDLAYASGSTGSPPRVLLNDGTGNFTDVTATNVPALALRSFAIAAGDTDNDGDLDLAVSDGGTFGGLASQAILLENDGSASFTNITGTNMPVDLYNCQDITFIDYDNDLDVDMCLSGKGGAGKRSRLYVNNNGVFSVNTVLDLIGTGATYEVDWADLDGDTDFDAAIQSVSGQTEGWGRNLGTGSAMTTSVFPLPNGGDDNEMAGVDYDNDGDLDVFVASLAAQEKAYRNNGDATFTNVNSIIQAQGDSSLDFAFGDLNGNGTLDMVTAQGESGSFVNKVYLNSGSADTLAPVFVAVETPGAIDPSATVFRANLRDQLSDDGEIGVVVTYGYTTVGAGSGSGTAINMGGGLYRAAVGTSGATQVSFTWTATDGAGNVTVNGPIVIGGPAGPWTDIGRSLPGVSGSPLLVGNGSLLTGSSGSIDLSNAAPSAPALLFISLSSSPVPFKGGQLCAFPFVLTVAAATNGSGDLVLGWPSWPAGLSGQSLFFQYGISDGAAVANIALSNCLQGDVP
jgi:hypothetical protein